MLPPIHTLTEEQAVAELAEIMDAAPPEDQVFERNQWARGNGHRAQQLEAHIVHLHKKVGQGGEAPAPALEIVNSEVTPSHHLQPEPVPTPEIRQPAPAATTEKPMPHAQPKKDPAQVIADAVAAAGERHAAILKDPSNRDLRKKYAVYCSAIRINAKKLGQAAPILLELPPLPDPKPKGGNLLRKRELPPALKGRAAALPPPVTREPEPSQAEVYGHHLGPVDRKVEAVPYEPPTAQDLLDAMSAPLPASTADLDQRDRMMVRLHVEMSPALRRVIEEAVTLVPTWVPRVMAEVDRARALFPESEHRTLALSEEAGEVVKAVLDLRNGKAGASWAKVETEIIQTMAMCVRLLEEGDPTVLPVVPDGEVA